MNVPFLPFSITAGDIAYRGEASGKFVDLQLLFPTNHKIIKISSLYSDYYIGSHHTPFNKMPWDIEMLMLSNCWSLLDIWYLVRLHSRCSIPVPRRRLPQTGNGHTSSIHSNTQDIGSVYWFSHTVVVACMQLRFRNWSNIDEITGTLASGADSVYTN